MATTFINSYLPITVYADPGQTISLGSIVSQNYGTLYGQISPWAYVRSINYMTSLNYSYWDPSHPSVSTIQLNGNTTAFETSVMLPSAASLGSATLTGGNPIFANVSINHWLDSAHTVVEQDYIAVVPLRFQKDYKVAPTPQDVVNAAFDFDAAYRGVPNANSGGGIARTVAEACGAAGWPGAYNDPTLNQDGGLWRVVYRGSSAPAGSDWQSLLQPGDSVRIQWLNPGASPGHSFIVTASEGADGNIQIFDNTLKFDGTNCIGIHSVDYSILVDPAQVTIFRLSPDHRFSINGDVANANVVGTTISDDIRATWGRATVKSGDGDDLIRLTAGGNIADGGSGTDTVIYGSTRANATVTKISSGWTVKSGSGTIDVLSNVERIQFSDSSVASDTSGNAGQVYRLYQAAFNRTPDAGGLGDWIYGMDNGASLLNVSAGFVNSAEFKSVYGQNPTDAEVVTRFYQNVLHRAPEQAGFDYWMNQLQSSLQTRTQVLTGFSESAENQALVIGVIQNGIEYTQHHA